MSELLAAAPDYDPAMKLPPVVLAAALSLSACGPVRETRPAATYSDDDWGDPVVTPRVDAGGAGAADALPIAALIDATPEPTEFHCLVDADNPGSLDTPCARDSFTCEVMYDSKPREVGDWICSPRSTAWCFDDLLDDGRTEERCTATEYSCAATRKRVDIGTDSRTRLSACEAREPGVLRPHTFIPGPPDAPDGSELDEVARTLGGDDEPSPSTLVGPFFCTNQLATGDGICFRDEDRCWASAESSYGWSVCFDQKRAVCFSAFERLDKAKVELCFTKISACQDVRKVMLKDQRDMKVTGKCRVRKK